MPLAVLQRRCETGETSKTSKNDNIQPTDASALHSLPDQGRISKSIRISLEFICT